MNNFSYKDIYLEDDTRVLEVNILPDKYCNFDCVFCPIGRSHNKIDVPQSFEKTDNSLKELEEILDNNNVDLVFVNSKGEAFVNSQIRDVISLVKSKGRAIGLLSNGYLLGKEEFMEIANKCDEVIGEIKVISEEQFQKLQRPIDGYTMTEYINNMISFNRQYIGKFIIEVTIIKGYNDTEDAINIIKEFIKDISPGKVIVARINDERFMKKLGISDEEYERIKKILMLDAQ